MPALVTVLGSRIKLANSNFDEEFINYARQHGLHVCWIGIQHGPAEKPCQPLDPLECKTRPED
jgi:hypothetical protein